MTNSNTIAGIIVAVVRKDMGNLMQEPAEKAVVELILAHPTSPSHRCLITDATGQVEFTVEELNCTYLLRVSYGAQQLQRTDYFAAPPVSETDPPEQTHTFSFYLKS